MLRAIKIRLYPNKTQEQTLNKVLGCYRFVYNQMLAQKQNAYKTDKINLKVTELFKNASEFLNMEQELIDIQKKAVEEKVPKFSQYRGIRGFTRISQYEGFVFDDQENIDEKVWKTKEVDGKMLSTPNLRTKAGKEMKKFLKSFKRTTCWDVDHLLGLDKKSIYGNFYPADLFKHNHVIYIFIDSQYRDIFEQENADAKEITYGEMEKAIDEYNKKEKQN